MHNLISVAMKKVKLRTGSTQAPNSISSILCSFSLTVTCSTNYFSLQNGRKCFAFDCRLHTRGAATWEEGDGTGDKIEAVSYSRVYFHRMFEVRRCLWILASQPPLLMAVICTVSWLVRF